MTLLDLSSVKKKKKFRLCSCKITGSITLLQGTNSKVSYITGAKHYEPFP